MRRRTRRAPSEPNPEKLKATESLKAAFKHEVRPADYLLKVWLTALLVGAYFGYLSASRQGSFQAELLFPLDFTWHPRDPLGTLYMETWAGILVNGLQAGFVFWGSVLIFLGVFRAFNAHKYVFACFYLGIAFIGLSLVLPSWIETILRMLIEKCPALVS